MRWEKEKECVKNLAEEYGVSIHANNYKWNTHFSKRKICSYYRNANKYTF